MKKKNNLIQPASNESMVELKEILEKRFSSVDKNLETLNRQMTDTQKDLKVIDQKRLDAEREIKFDLTSRIFDTRQRLEKTIRAEIEIATKELQKGLENRLEQGFKEIRQDLKETEGRLNKRITHVGDLITIELGQKHQKLQRRVAQLEQRAHAA